MRYITRRCNKSVQSICIISVMTEDRFVSRFLSRWIGLKSTCLWVNVKLLVVCILLNRGLIELLLITLMNREWRHNVRDCVSNHQPHDYLPNRSFRRRSKNTSKLRVNGVRGIHRWSVISPHKGPVTRKMFLFDDVIIHECSEKRWLLV